MALSAPPPPRLPPLRSASRRRTPTSSSAIRPFHVSFPDSTLDDMRKRIKATRWPDRETVNDDSQGVPLAMIQGLAAYWATDYDWRKCEAKLNALPKFITDDRRARHPLHSREVETCKRAAAHRHARLAWIDHRTTQDHRAADRSDGTWWQRVGCIPRRHSLDTRLRVFGKAASTRAGTPPRPRAPGPC